MEKSTSLHGTPDQAVGVLNTKFITRDQTEALIQVLDLAFGELDRIGGGLESSGQIVGVVGCCQRCCHHPKVL